MENDLRWEQRFDNYERALKKLQEAVAYILEQEEQQGRHPEVLDDILREGLIQRFEYTHELAWNVMKDYAHWQGNSSVGGSRDATREAFSLQLISDGKVWMDMIGSRNQTSHTYNEDTAREIFLKIVDKYYPAFQEFYVTMKEKRGAEQEPQFE